MDIIERLAVLLADSSPRKRIAAAVVLGELKVRDAKIIAALVNMAKDDIEPYAEAAIEALGQLKTLKALPVFF
jgi:HEAT repeat protein